MEDLAAAAVGLFTSPAAELNGRRLLLARTHALSPGLNLAPDLLRLKA